MADMTACLQAADFEDVLWIERFSNLEAMRYDTPTIDNVCLARHACDDTHAAPPPVLDRQMMRPARQHVALTEGYIRETRATTSFSSCNSRGIPVRSRDGHIGKAEEPVKPIRSSR